MSYSDLEKMYYKLGTINAVAEKLGVTPRTVKAWFAEGDIVGLKHKTRKRTPEEQPELKRWMVAHPGTRLPRSDKKIAEMTGITYSSVHNFFTRRKRKLTEWLKTLKPFNELNLVLKDDNGKLLPTRAVKDYAFRLDRYTLALQVYGTYRSGGVFTYTTTVRKYALLVNAASKQGLS